MNSIGLGIITFNEEELISKVLRSASFVDQVVIIDSFSTDKTVQIAQEFGAKVIQRDWKGYADQKQYCLDQLNTDWILILDGDEILSTKLADEIKHLIRNNPKFDAYYLKRNLIFLNKELKHGRGQDKQLRLVKNGIGKYSKRNIHERIIVSCEAGELVHPIKHYSSQCIQDEIDKITRDTEMELENYQYQKIGIKEIFMQPFQFFIVMFIKGTWRDGLPGLIFLTLTTIKYITLRAKLYEIYINKRSS